MSTRGSQTPQRLHESLVAQLDQAERQASQKDRVLGDDQLAQLERQVMREDGPVAARGRGLRTVAAVVQQRLAQNGEAQGRVTTQAQPEVVVFGVGSEAETAARHYRDFAKHHGRVAEQAAEGQHAADAGIAQGAARAGAEHLAVFIDQPVVAAQHREVRVRLQVRCLPGQPLGVAQVVAVHARDQLMAGCGQPQVQGEGQAGQGGAEQAHPRVMAIRVFQQRAQRLVPGAVHHHQQLDARVRLRQHAVDGGSQEGRVGVAGHDHAHAGQGRGVHEMATAMGCGSQRAIILLWKISAPCAETQNLVIHAQSFSKKALLGEFCTGYLLSREAL